MSLRSDLYALTHRGNPGDVAFYRGVCASSERVLELGAGYGRMIAGLARRRGTLVGLECDAELLATARRRLRALPLTQRRSVRLVAGDMQRFDLGQRFDCVLLPYNGLYCLLGKRAALDCFRAVRAALEPGGVFAFDVWNAESFHRRSALAPADAEGPTPIVSLRHAGRTWDVFEQTRIQRARQRLAVNYTYAPREGGAPLQLPIAQRYFRARELTELLGRAGLDIQARYGDFAGGRFGARSPHLIVVARSRRV